MKDEFYTRNKDGGDLQNGRVNLSYVPDTFEYDTKNEQITEIVCTKGSPIPSESKSTAAERAQWGHGLEFLMSCIAMSVGLGNVWRFPFTAYENGGGAFLIPYIITLLFIGRPMYYLEMALGQFTSKGNVRMFSSLAPVFHGIGYGQLFSTLCVATYYCSLMSITLYYLFNSFMKVLPWSVCQPEWDHCIDTSTNTSYKNGTSSVELYFTQTVLHQKEQIDDGIGVPDWQLTGYLFLSWAVLFLVAIKGVKSSGKASYFLALFPYVVMIALLIRAATLKGAYKGILFFIKPEWGQLLNPKVWYAAVTQCFFSLTVGFGPIVMYSSYNDFRHNINRDTLIVTSIDTCTSLLAGFTIFGVLGNLADNLGTNIEDVVKTGGAGLAFISYPDAISKMDWVPQLFAVLFFFMLFVLGIGSLLGSQSCIATVIKDDFPHFKDWWVAAITCFGGFLTGLVYVTPGGQFILNLVDYFGGTFNIYVMAIGEMIVVVWLYGLEDLCLDMEYMLNMKVHAYWRICWSVITPVLLLVILIYSLVITEPIKYGSIPYPTSALAIGWLLLAVGLVQIPFWAIRAIYKRRHLGYPKMISEAFSNKKWGPKNPEENKKWREFKEQRKNERRERNENLFSYVFNSLIGR